MSANDQWGWENHPGIGENSCIHLAFISRVINRPQSRGSREQTVSAWPLTCLLSVLRIALGTENEPCKHEHEGSKATLILVNRHRWNRSNYFNPWRSRFKISLFYALEDIVGTSGVAASDWGVGFFTLPLISFLLDSLSFWIKITSASSSIQLFSTSAWTTYLWSCERRTNSQRTRNPRTQKDSWCEGYWGFFSLIGNKIVKYNSGMRKDFLFFLPCLCFFLPSLAAEEARRKRVCWPTRSYQGWQLPHHNLSKIPICDWNEYPPSLPPCKNKWLLVKN